MAVKLFGCDTGGGGSGGSIVHVPITGLETDAVVAFTGDNSATDLAGDSVLDQDPPVQYGTDLHYTGAPTDTFFVDSGVLLGTTGDTAHKVAISSPLTVSVFYKATSIQTTAYVFASSTQTSSFNYGLAHVSGFFSVRFGAHTSTAVPFAVGCWTHVCLTAPANRLSFKFYVNGKLAFTSGAVAAGTVGAGDSLKLGNVDAVNGDLTGLISDVLIADSEYDATAVRTLAENAFGHVLP